MQTLPKCTVAIGILFCYLSSLSFLQARDVPCERFPFHPDCRGIQKKSHIDDETSYRNAQRLADLFGITESSGKSSYSSRSRNNINNNSEKSRLWTALLDRGLNPEAMYDWYLAHLEKNGENRQKFMEENYPAKDLIDDDY